MVFAHESILNLISQEQGYISHILLIFHFTGLVLVIGTLLWSRKASDAVPGSSFGFDRPHGQQHEDSHVTVIARFISVTSLVTGADKFQVNMRMVRRVCASCHSLPEAYFDLVILKIASRCEQQPNKVTSSSCHLDILCLSLQYTLASVDLPLKF